MATKTYAGVAYSNGKTPTSLLGEVLPSGIHGTSRTKRAYLRKDAAASWNRAVKEVKAKTGLTLSVRGWNRSYAEQVLFFRQRYTAGAYSRYGDYRRWNGVQYGRVRGAAAAAPGYSNHGWGLAVDVNDFGGVGQFNNARRNKAYPILAKHGWTETEGRRVSEPWHLVYDPSKDRGKKAASKSHTRVTTARLNLRKSPNGALVRVLPEGYRFSVRNGKSKKVAGVWWVQTTSKHWVASDYTKKV